MRTIKRNLVLEHHGIVNQFRTNIRGASTKNDTKMKLAGHEILRPKSTDSYENSFSALHCPLNPNRRRSGIWDLGFLGYFGIFIWGDSWDVLDLHDVWDFLELFGIFGIFWDFLDFLRIFWIFWILPQLHQSGLLMPGISLVRPFWTWEPILRG